MMLWLVACGAPSNPIDPAATADPETAEQAITTETEVEGEAGAVEVEGNETESATTNEPAAVVNTTGAQSNLTPLASPAADIPTAAQVRTGDWIKGAEDPILTVVEYADFQCPAHSSRIPGRECYDSLDDCVCESGYAKNGEICQLATKICPSGQILDGSGYCVLSWCLADYKCPAHAYRRDGRSCYNNFEDCQCESGFAKVGDACISNCPFGQKLDHFEYCVMKWCVDNYVCPMRSARKPNRDCYNNFDDCDCELGYKKQTNQGKDYCVSKGCYFNFTCPANSSRLPGQQCYDDFQSDCACNTGYKVSGSQCVPV